MFTSTQLSSLLDGTPRTTYQSDVDCQNHYVKNEEMESPYDASAPNDVEVEVGLAIKDVNELAPIC